MDYIRSPADAGNTEAETFSPWTTRVAAEQAQRAAKRAAKLLPNHRRMSLERMFGAASRSRGKLS